MNFSFRKLPRRTIVDDNRCTIENLFLYLCSDRYRYCRKCIFTPLRQLENNFVLDECCPECPTKDNRDDIIWFTPPLSPPNAFESMKNGPEKDEYKCICVETRIIVDFCIWCSLTNRERGRESLKTFFNTYKNGTIKHSTRRDALCDMDDLGFFSQNFVLVDCDADELENFA